MHQANDALIDAAESELGSALSGTLKYRIERPKPLRNLN
jgi:hypothetical protein